jgi:hypothetical protein
MITRTEFGRWANNIKLSNGQIELIATLDVGPRLVRFGFVGGQNLFKEFPEQQGKSGESEFMLRGGHRLWHAPEVMPRTYYPDNQPVQLEELNELAIRLTPPPETSNNLQKQVEVQMAADANVVTVTHRITNLGAWDVTLAPWALSVMNPGGMAIIPLPEKPQHEGNFVPNIGLILWPVTDLADSRYRWGSKYITFSYEAAKGPGKFGLNVELGWAAYQLNNQLFVKYFDYLPDACYPDHGCNFETYSDQKILEVETLGPLTTLAPGATAEHVETWRAFDQVPTVSDDASIDQHVLPLIGK